METKLAPGFHVRPGRAVDTSAYGQFTGRWSRLFVPLVLGAADLQPGDQVLDVATGTGEAAVAIMPVIGPSGRLIGADIAPAMLESARGRLKEPGFLTVAADGQALPFANGTLHRPPAIPECPPADRSSQQFDHLPQRLRADFAAKAHPCPTAKRYLDDALALRPPRPAAIRRDRDWHHCAAFHCCLRQQLPPPSEQLVAVHIMAPRHDRHRCARCQRLRHHLALLESPPRFEDEAGDPLGIGTP